MGVHNDDEDKAKPSSISSHQTSKSGFVLFVWAMISNVIPADKHTSNLDSQAKKFPPLRQPPVLLQYPHLQADHSVLPYECKDFSSTSGTLFPSCHYLRLQYRWAAVPKPKREHHNQIWLHSYQSHETDPSILLPWKVKMFSQWACRFRQR